MYNERIYRAFSSFNTFQSLLTHRDDETYTPDELRLYATLDAWCYAPYCAMRNARGAIFTDSLTSRTCRLVLRRLSGAGNNPQAKYDCCCSGCYRRGKELKEAIVAFWKKLCKNFNKNRHIICTACVMMCLICFWEKSIKTTDAAKQFCSENICKIVWTPG